MADFETLKTVKYWTQRCIPLVYDNSLSIYQLLEKVINELNKLITNNNMLPEYIANMIKEYISSGAIEQVVREILANYILNVKYPPSGITPAVGDGSQDDTAAVQGCIDYASAQGGGAVYLPYGAYSVQSLTLKSNVSLFGFDRYTTRVVLRGGATNSLILLNGSNAGIYNLTLDGNAGIQVNDINVVSMIAQDVLLNNLIIEDGYQLLVYNGTGGHLQINDIIFGNAVQRCVNISGTSVVDARGMNFSNLSSVSGIDIINVSSNGGIYEFISTARCDTCLSVSGNDNNFSGIVNGATTAYVDSGLRNTIDFKGNEKKEYYANDVEILSNNLILRTNNPVTYKTPTTENFNINTIPLKDYSGLEYKTIVYKPEMFNFYNPLLYGADKTGVNDSSDAINNCLELGDVILPPGTYKCDNEILAKHNLYGYGATLYCDINLEEHNITIAGLTIHAVDAGISINELDGITIKDMKIIGGVTGIHLTGASNVLIENVNISEQTHIPFYGSNCTFCTVSNCKADNSLGDTHTFQFANGHSNKFIGCNSYNAHTFGFSLTKENHSSVVGCCIRDCIKEGMNINDSYYCILDGNTIYSSKSTDYGISIWGDSNRYANYNIVSNNVVSNVAKAGIAVNDNCLGNIVIGNSIYNCCLVPESDNNRNCGIILSSDLDNTHPQQTIISNNIVRGSNVSFSVSSLTGINNVIDGDVLPLLPISVNYKEQNIIKTKSATITNNEFLITGSDKGASIVSEQNGGYYIDGLDVVLKVQFTVSGTYTGNININMPRNINNSYPIFASCINVTDGTALPVTYGDTTWLFIPRSNGLDGKTLIVTAKFRLS